MHNLFGKKTEKADPVAHQKNVGVEGSKRRARIDDVRALALGGSTVGEGLAERLMPLVYGLSFNLMDHHTSRMMRDDKWTAAFEAVARRAARRLPSGNTPRVCVLGLGSCVPALVAGSAGAAVLWVERVERFAECARQLVGRNGLAGRVQVHRAQEWERLKLDSGQCDTVITE